MQLRSQQKNLCQKLGLRSEFFSISRIELNVVWSNKNWCININEKQSDDWRTDEFALDSKQIHKGKIVWHW